MTKKLLVAALICAIAIPSCKKADNSASTKVYNSVNEITVPSGFNWESSRTIAFNVGITDARFATANHAIAIYDGDPYAGSNLLSKGSANTNTAFTSNLSIAKTINEVYVVKTSPDGSQIIQKVTLAANVALSFGATDPTVAYRMPAQRTTGATNLDDCSSGCTNTITTNTSNVDVNTGNVICITGSNITVGFQNVNGGVIRVCGTNVTLQNLNMGGSATLYVTAGGTANVSGLNYNSSNATITNYGTINGVFADGGYFNNYGTFNCSGDFNLNGSSQTFLNSGIMNVAGSFNNGSHSVATNNGTMVVSGNFQQNGGSAAFVNNCSLTVNGNYNQSAAVKNYSLIKVAGTSTINSSTSLDFYNGAMLKTNNFILDGSVVRGNGSTSLVKITGSTNIMNSGAVLTGAVQVCASTTVGASYLTSGAANGCSLYIATTGCNGVGNGTPVVTDTDGDGVPDATDEYPTDPTKAYNNYYPTSTGGGTLAFEDQWPTKGDFDMNDVVVGYRYQIVTNASNNVVKVIGNYSLLATGGELGNGFGVQFPVNAGNISNVTGGTQEAGQSKAVIIVFNNMRTAMLNWNTILGNPTSAAVNYTVSFDVTGGPSISTFGLSSYNPFIWNLGLGNNRGREIHLSAHAPTDLGYTSYFGTSDDNSSVSGGRYYVTTTGLPYAIDVPVASFNYPVERKDITQGYLNFGAWGASGGTSFVDWYSNTASSYRNTSNLYVH